jgi:hypothetical protein
MPATEVDLRDCRQFFPRNAQNPIANNRFIVFWAELSSLNAMGMKSGVVQ